jgi:hypothetical protein
MPEVTLKDLEAEKARLHGTDFNGIVVLVDSSKMGLRIKDSRSEERGANPRDVNQAKLTRGISVGAWAEYTLEESQATFT